MHYRIWIFSSPICDRYQGIPTSHWFRTLNEYDTWSDYVRIQTSHLLRMVNMKLMYATTQCLCTCLEYKPSNGRAFTWTPRAMDFTKIHRLHKPDNSTSIYCLLGSPGTLIRDLDYQMGLHASRQAYALRYQHRLHRLSLSFSHFKDKIPYETLRTTSPTVNYLDLLTLM